jgi:hypothetical protein
MRFYYSTDTEIVKRRRNVKYTEAYNKGEKRPKHSSPHQSPSPGDRPSEGGPTISPEFESESVSVLYYFGPQRDYQGDGIQKAVDENFVTVERLQPTESTS